MSPTPHSPFPDPGGQYDEAFFSYTTSGSLKSARAIIQVIQELVPGISSVIDFGCAQGAWLSVWQEKGVSDTQGLDGDYVDTSALLIEPEAFRAVDLGGPVNVGRRYDLAHSFEVAEHIAPENAEIFITSLTTHSDYILFSAAPPGQGGEHHINEQPYDYWRDLFKKHGYFAYDCIRPCIASISEISFWYRYNTLLFVKEGLEKELSTDVIASRVPDGKAIPDISPVLFKLRKALVRTLPPRILNWMARMKSRAAAS